MESNIYNLSFIFATRNRLPFLKITLEKLLAEVLLDEEIIVVDGNSNDGTKEYLQKLYEAGKIQQFISEPDKNQAHGWNKAMLMAKGILIKKIIDDDVFCYSAIRECKNYMLLHQHVDVCISNDLGSSIQNYKHIERYSKLPQFAEWKNGKVPSFSCGDVHLLIRQSSLSYIGLYFTDFVNMDWEYSLRMSYLQANITYYTGYNAMSIGHPNTITTLRNEKKIVAQGKRGEIMYEYKGDKAGISWWSHLKIFIGRSLYAKKSKETVKLKNELTDMTDIYNYFYNYMSQLAKETDGIFY